MLEKKKIFFFDGHDGHDNRYGYNRSSRIVTLFLKKKGITLTDVLMLF